MKKPPDRPSREAIWKISICLGVLFLVSLACSTGDQSLPPTSPPVQEPTVPAEQGAEPAVSQTAPATRNFSEISDYYGPACPAGEEENAPYRWSVEMLVDTNNNIYEGTIKFHNCPGGGRAIYRVSGSRDGDLLRLTGDLVSGSGALNDTAPKQQAFTFDPASGLLEPNLAP